MVKEVRPSVPDESLSVGIVQSEFNEYVTDRLREGTVQTLTESGVASEDITLYKVPGSFEIPGTTSRVLSDCDHDGVICLGSVVRGETPHFDYICTQVSRGISELSMEHDVPVIFGVLTTETLEQALERAGTDSSNKGREAANALLRTVGLYRAL